MTDDTVINEPSLTAGEVEMLLFALDRSRATFAWKTGGLDAAALNSIPTHKCEEHEIIALPPEDTREAPRPRIDESAGPSPRARGRPRRVPPLSSPTLTHGAGRAGRSS
ncbi:hypothetical protein [Streptosporangium sp. LJ11]|uniref:hypothetical protein n=1 Tax=Streptosporangium sp. LJ11 TaxID=3436927 RepID=UPI003F7A4ED1